MTNRQSGSLIFSQRPALTVIRSQLSLNEKKYERVHSCNLFGHSCKTRCQTIMAIVTSNVNFITRVKIHFDASAGLLLLYLYQHMQIYIRFSISIGVPVTLEPTFIETLT